MKYVMYEHAGSGNHGCEAIVRTTQKILGDTAEYYLQTLNKKEDLRYGLINVEFIELSNCSLRDSKVSNLMARMKCRLNKKLDYDTREAIYCYRDLIKKDSIAHPPHPPIRSGSCGTSKISLACYFILSINRRG